MIVDFDECKNVAEQCDSRVEGEHRIGGQAGDLEGGHWQRCSNSQTDDGSAPERAASRVLSVDQRQECTRQLGHPSRDGDNNGVAGVKPRSASISVNGMRDLVFQLSYKWPKSNQTSEMYGLMRMALKYASSASWN